jgi:hypothetical protein
MDDREPIDVKKGFETEPEMSLTETEKWVLVAAGLIFAVSMLLTGQYLLCLAMCAVIGCILVLLWRAG